MSLTTRRALALMGAAVLGLGVAGCSATPDGPAAGGSSSDIASLVQADQTTEYDAVTDELGQPTVPDGAKVCYVTRTLSNEYWSFVAQGVENRAKELGIQSQIFAVNDEASITEQLDKAKSALTQGCSILLASPISATGLDSVFSDALAQGVPVVVLNDAKGTLPGVVYSGPDSLVTGASAADFLAEKLPRAARSPWSRATPFVERAQPRRGLQERVGEAPRPQPGGFSNGQLGPDEGSGHRHRDAHGQPRPQGVLRPE